MNTANSTDSINLHRSQTEIKESELMSQYLDKRVTNIEKSFSTLSTEFIGYARRTAKLRNNGDKIADILLGYVDTQQFNSSSHEYIKVFSNTLSVVEDFRNVELDRIKDHVVRPMIDYNASLKDVKVELKKDMAARKKEIASYKKLEKSQKGGTIGDAKARTSTQFAVLDATRQSEKLLQTVSHFEEKKLEHMQSVLKSFIHIEMLWHMRALERYTEAYRALNSIDCQSDLNEFLEDLRNFRSHDHLTRSNSNLNLAGRRSQSMTNLRSTNASSQGDLTGGGNKNELRTSVTFEDQHQRSKSFQQRQVFRDTVELNKSKPPVANGHRPLSQPPQQSDESEYTDSEEYTDDDGTTTASKTASARSINRGGSNPVPPKRAR